jgi:hypothetical protein
MKLTNSGALDGVDKVYSDFSSYILSLSFSGRPRSKGIMVGPAFILEDIVIELIKRIFIESIGSIVC